MNQYPYIILELGTHYTRVGFSWNNEPFLTIRTVITMDNKEEKFTIGEDAINKNIKVQNVILPIKDKSINNYDYLENFLYNLFLIELNIDWENKHLIIINSIFTNKKEKDILTEIFFETYNIEGLIFWNNPILSFLSLIPLNNYENNQLNFREILNSITGIRIEMGDGETSIVPISNGFIIKEACKKLSINGKQVTKYILNELKKLNPDINIEVLNILSNHIKENFCSLESNFKEDEIQIIDISNRKVKINGKIKNSFNIYFDSANTEDNQDLIKKLFLCYKESPINIRKDIINNIIITGGNSGVPGLKEVITLKLKNLINSQKIKTDVNIDIHPLNLESSWIGGNLYTYNKDLNNIIYSKKQYFDKNDSN